MITMFKSLLDIWQNPNIPMIVKIVCAVITALAVLFGFYITVIYRIDKKLHKLSVSRVFKKGSKKKPITNKGNNE